MEGEEEEGEGCHELSTEVSVTDNQMDEEEKQEVISHKKNGGLLR